MKYREILIFVVGGTPQVITETVFALANQKPPICPDEIIVITTSDGAKITEEALIKRGILKKLCQEYKIPYIAPNYKVPSGPNGLPLSDIRTKEENEVMANLINDVVKEKASNQENRLHCSIAGGRKTMSFYLGSALQLYGRAQDKLYHVLVTPEFEGNKDFFYKPKKNLEIKTKDGKVLNTEDATIELAELPFVRLGDKIKLGDGSFTQSIKSGQEAINEAVFSQNVYLNLKKRELKIGDIEIKLQPIYLALYATLLNLKKQCKEKKCIGCRKCCLPRNNWEDEKKNIFKTFYEKLRPFSQGDWFSNKHGYDTILSSAISRINKIIKDSIKSDSLAQYYLIKSIKIYGNTSYQINIEPKKIKIEG